MVEAASETVEALVLERGTVLEQLTRAPAIFILAGALVSCSKTVPLSNTSASTVSDAASTMIYTPFGPRRSSDVIKVESTAKLRFAGGHLMKVDKQTGKVLQDFGKQQPLDYVQRQTAVQGTKK